MKHNKVLELSMEFAVDALKFCESIKDHYAIRSQFERSATSIGANIHEANYAQSLPDFISKLQIALKECYESEYRLAIFRRSGITDPDSVDPLEQTAGSIRRMLIASINTAKSKTG